MKPAKVYKRFIRGESIEDIAVLLAKPGCFQDFATAEKLLRQYLNARDKRLAETKRVKKSLLKVVS